MIKKFALLLFLLVCPGFSIGATYWVSTTGSNSNTCTSEGSACLSIQKAISLATAGDIIYIKAGTYIENSTTSPHTSACTWFGATASLCAAASGTASSRILITSAPSVADGSVIIDSEDARVGFQLLGHDYITFRGLKFVNNFKYAIINDAPNTSTHTVSASNISRGVTIENCIVDGVYTDEGGDNIGAIGPWSSQDWIIRNNELKNVTGGSGIRAYGVINAKVEHNTILNVSEGILWKDHFVKNDTTRGLYSESEISYNLIQASSFGINIQTRGAGTAEAGHNYIHHNIIYGLTDSEPTGIHYMMADAPYISGNLKIFHNTIDNTVNSGIAINLTRNNKTEIKGNILARFGLGIQSQNVEATLHPHIVYSNYNVFMGNNSNLVLLDRYSTTASAYYPTLANWQAATDVESYSLTFNSPDVNSSAVSYSAGLFNMTDPARPYRLAGANPAIDKMPDGTDAGAYQYGTEIIGRIPPTTYKPPAKME